MMRIDVVAVVQLDFDYFLLHEMISMSEMRLRGEDRIPFDI